jgi:hypothetical protein
MNKHSKEQRLQLYLLSYIDVKFGLALNEDVPEQRISRIKHHMIFRPLCWETLIKENKLLRFRRIGVWKEKWVQNVIRKTRKVASTWKRQVGVSHINRDFFF